MRSQNTYIGGHIERVEDERFLRGAGQYLGDLEREELWHAAVLRSSVGHGRIRSLDTSDAQALPGVRAIVTAADIEGAIPTIPFRRPNPTIGPYAQPIIAREKVRYFGEPIALILADRPEIAEDALASVRVDIEQLPAVVTRETAIANVTLLFETTATNVAAVFTAEKGDAAAAFRAAPCVVQERFSTQRQTALPMELRGLLAEWDARRNACVFTARRSCRSSTARPWRR